MPHLPMRWSETWRVLAYTVAITLAFIALGRIEMQLFTLFGADNALARSDGSASADAQLVAAAEEVAAQSRQALDRVPGRRLAAFRIGYDLGYASAFMGSYAMSDPAVQAKARVVGAKHLDIARQLAAEIDLADLAELPVRNPKEYVELNQRFEADENGVAAAIEARLSPAHRHLYLLGAQLGGEASTVESSNGELTQPPVALIRRHATLAGVDRALWLPLAVQPRGEAPAETLRRYRSALTTLATDLAARDSGKASHGGDVASAPTR